LSAKYYFSLLLFVSVYFCLLLSCKISLLDYPRITLDDHPALYYFVAVHFRWEAMREYGRFLRKSRFP
ncbi:MAG: hypothetical protein RSG23_10920, partial [Gordonibacter sp.]